METIKIIVAGEEPSMPIYGPTMKVLKTGEVGDLVSYSKENFELRFSDGTIHNFHRREIENL